MSKMTQAAAVLLSAFAKEIATTNKIQAIASFKAAAFRARIPALVYCKAVSLMIRAKTGKAVMAKEEDAEENNKEDEKEEIQPEKEEQEENEGEEKENDNKLRKAEYQARISFHLFTWTLLLALLSGWFTSLLGIDAIVGFFLFGIIVPRHSRLYASCLLYLETFLSSYFLLFPAFNSCR